MAGPVAAPASVRTDLGDIARITEIATEVSDKRLGPSVAK